MTGKA